MFCSCNMHNMQWKWFSTHCDAITSYDSCSCIKIIPKDHSFYYVLNTFMVTLASPVCVILFLSLDVNFNLPVSVLWYNSSVFFFHNLLPSVWDAYSIWTSFVLSASIPWSIKTLVHETLCFTGFIGVVFHSAFIKKIQIPLINQKCQRENWILGTPLDLEQREIKKILQSLPSGHHTRFPILSFDAKFPSLTISQWLHKLLNPNWI